MSEDKREKPKLLMVLAMFVHMLCVEWVFHECFKKKARYERMRDRERQTSKTGNGSSLKIYLLFKVQHFLLDQRTRYPFVFFFSGKGT